MSMSSSAYLAFECPECGTEHPTLERMRVCEKNCRRVLDVWKHPKQIRYYDDE